MYLVDNVSSLMMETIVEIMISFRRGVLAIITKGDLDRLRGNQQKNNFGSQTQSMFVNGKFNHSNWNGGDSIIRQLFSLHREDGVRSETKVEELEFTYGNNKFWGDVVITHSYYDDRNYATIVFNCSAEIDGMYQADKIEDVAYFSWYKNRGTTESAKYNGERMTEDQYLFILNAIQATGFKFELT